MSIFKWHQTHWQDNGYLDEATENFNDLVDNKLTPSVHTVNYSLPLNYDIQTKFQDNILLSDISRQENIKDLKLVHTRLDSNIGSGSYIWWNNHSWIVLNEENNAVLSHKSYLMQKCGIELNINYKGEVYTYPVGITNLTLYSDGSKELVHMTLSSAKYSIQIAENEVTNSIEVGTRFIIRGRAFEVSLIDDFTIDNVKTLTVCETVINSLDDTDNNIARDEVEVEEGTQSSNAIIGDKEIFIGDTLEYSHYAGYKWEIDKNDALIIVLNENGRCKVKCKPISSAVGQQVKLRALNEYSAIVNEITITIRGLF
jgi:hypothetical protein